MQKAGEHMKKINDSDETLNMAEVAVVVEEQSLGLRVRTPEGWIYPHVVSGSNFSL